MPTYTYRCTKCSEEYEAFQSMSDPPLKRCKKCRGALRRTFHPVGIVLKGSGFHRTDYRSKSESHKASSDKSESKNETKSESKNETNSAKKTDSKSTSDPGSKASSDS